MDDDSELRVHEDRLHSDLTAVAAFMARDLDVDELQLEADLPYPNAFAESTLRAVIVRVPGQRGLSRTAATFLETLGWQFWPGDILRSVTVNLRDLSAHQRIEAEARMGSALGRPIILQWPWAAPVVDHLRQEPAVLLVAVPERQAVVVYRRQFDGSYDTTVDDAPDVISTEELLKRYSVPDDGLSTALDGPSAKVPIESDFETTLNAADVVEEQNAALSVALGKPSSQEEQFYENRQKLGLGVGLDAKGNIVRASPEHGLEADGKTWIAEAKRGVADEAANLEEIGPTLERYRRLDQFDGAVRRSPDLSESLSDDNLHGSGTGVGPGCRGAKSHETSNGTGMKRETKSWMAENRTAFAAQAAWHGSHVHPLASIILLDQVLARRSHSAPADSGNMNPLSDADIAAFLEALAHLTEQHGILITSGSNGATLEPKPSDFSGYHVISSVGDDVLAMAADSDRTQR